ncbi:MAG: helix-turn-helix domain-containing protein [Polaromonas sp.]|uniref:helix-turn-helix domain-containing protein n=1 Tax=Polaromonas sp. TaxID=1869339 RepID=UPI002487C018|nr:helix-turn-helix domain-containing protein [Polaromonas sp.]MDI1267850.1 helix-turn-helix domain-containing protein [Polaromonas sp.]
MLSSLSNQSYEELSLGALDPGRVEAFWRYRVHVRTTQVLLPDGRMDLVAHCTARPDGSIIASWLALSGPADVPGTMNTRPDTVSLGVRFQVGWGGACLGLCPSAMRNVVVVGTHAAQLLGEPAQQLLRAKSLEEMRSAIESVVLKKTSQAACSAGQNRALKAIELIRAGSSETLDDLLASNSKARRTLRRDVVAAAGLPLRTLAAIFRFQRAMAMLKSRRHPSLSDLADAVGYADQSHMTREFRRFSGFTPARPATAPIVDPEFLVATWP